MDDGFKDRVDKVFASISSSSSSSSSSWSLSDSQVEKREWNRSNRDRDRDDDQIPSFLHHRHDWDIRSSIGLDSTLDNEEEEDAYDKMAQGQDNTGSLYIKDVHGLYLNSHNVLPDQPITKSILKRKTYDEVAKPAKRVSFHSTCKNAASTPTPAPVSSGNGRAVPDYILNPSKYTRYSLDHLLMIVKKKLLWRNHQNFTNHQFSFQGKRMQSFRNTNHLALALALALALSMVILVRCRRMMFLLKLGMFVNTGRLK